MTSPIFGSRVGRITAHPSPQYPQVVSARFIIQGRNSYIESRLVIAPTGQICTQPPQNSQSNWCPAKCTISVIVLRPALPNALTSMTSSQYRTQRRQETQRFISFSINGLKNSFWYTRLVPLKPLALRVC